MKKIKVIGFDADDTLWVNEPFYRDTEKEFTNILSDYGSEEYLRNTLFDIEMKNLKLYGYGIKSFVLSMIETAILVTKGHLHSDIVGYIIDMGKQMIDKPVELIDGVNEVLSKIYNAKYELVVATKGDLLDQERKLNKSKLDKYFHHIEIMSDKKEDNYLKLLNHLNIRPNEFLMVGNSMKSDILPVKNIGACAVFVPFHTTWLHEVIETPTKDNYHEINNIRELLPILDLERQ